jgi:peptidoglycan/LPS O-acetylase OafA/YrhL
VTEEVVAPPPGHPRFPHMDALRAIAALGVLVSHAGYFSGASQDAWYGPAVANGTAGVTVFFVLSGFLLYRPFLAADLHGAPKIRVGDFARRRVLRIFPAYWLALTAIAIYPGLVGVFSGDWFWFYGLLQVYGPGTRPIEGLAAAWSLCVEVSFYALLPVYAAAMRRVAPHRRIRTELAALAALGTASVALRGVSLASGGSWLELTLVGTFAWFALGMALAVVSVAPAGRLQALVAARPGACWALAGAAYLVLCLVLAEPAAGPLAYSQGQWFAQHVLAAVVAVALVAPAALGPEAGGWPRRILRWPPLAWLGLVSYGVFLWQGGWVLGLWEHGANEWVPSAPFLVLTLATLAGTVVCAAASYYLVERPLMRWKHPTRGRGRRDTAAAAASARASAPRSAPGSPR